MFLIKAYIVVNKSTIKKYCWDTIKFILKKLCMPHSYILIYRKNDSLFINILCIQNRSMTFNITELRKNLNAEQTI